MLVSWIVLLICLPIHFEIENSVLCWKLHIIGNNRVKRLKDFKVNERISRPAVKVFPMQFGDDEATRRIAIHHLKRLILQHKEKIQKLAYKWVWGFSIPFLAYLNFKMCHKLPAFIKIHPIALSKSHFRIWTKLKNLSIKKHVHMDKMNSEVKQYNSMI